MVTLAKFDVRAECWSPRGRRSTWRKQIEARTAGDAITAADLILCRAHHRYKITAVAVDQPQEA